MQSTSIQANIQFSFIKSRVRLKKLRILNFTNIYVKEFGFVKFS